jgi:desulfoferrodoxin (superoxide reductase-like protein)
MASRVVDVADFVKEKHFPILDKDSRNREAVAILLQLF